MKSNPVVCLILVLLASPLASGDVVSDLVAKAGQGDTAAQMALGRIYIAGKGAPRNSVEAAKWFLISAEQGNSAAQCQIARMCLTGAGVPKDDVEAYKWSSLASAQGDMAAKKVLIFLEKRMTPGQVADGRKRSADFVEMKTMQKTAGVPVEPAGPINPE